MKYQSLHNAALEQHIRLISLSMRRLLICVAAGVAVQCAATYMLWAGLAEFWDGSIPHAFAAATVNLCFAFFAGGAVGNRFMNFVARRLGGHHA